LDKWLKTRLDFAIREILNNSVEHGNGFIKDKDIIFNVNIKKTIFIMDVYDQGDGFDINRVLENESNDSLDRKRNRGLKTIIDMGFTIKSSKGNVKLILELNSDEFVNKRKVEKMEFIINDGILSCKINKDLIAPNVKFLVEEMKKKLNEDIQYDEFVFDLSMVDGVDSMGITFLIGAYKDLTVISKNVKIKNISNNMLKLFKIMKLDEIFEFVK
jgi:anti-anti-sigma factor